MKQRKLMSKVLVLALAFVMVFAMTATAFAAPSGSVSVSVTQNNFNTDGYYVGDGGTPVTVQNKTITDYPVSLSAISAKIEDGLKTNYYLPSNVTDPMNGKSSVLDAIIVALQDNGITDIQTGWSSYTPAGGYISNFGNYSLQPNQVTYFNKNGEKWARSTGTGWNIAYKQADGTMIGAAVYASNIEIASGMDIIIDVSPYSIEWYTGQPWTEE